MYTKCDDATMERATRRILAFVFRHANASSLSRTVDGFLSETLWLVLSTDGITYEHTHGVLSIYEVDDAFAISVLNFKRNFSSPRTNEMR